MTYKKKNTWMLGIALLGLLWACLVPMRQAIGLYRKNKYLAVQLAKANGAAQKINRLEEANNQLGLYLQRGQSTAGLKDEIMRKATQLCQQEGVRLISLQDPETYETAGVEVKTIALTLSSRYHALLRVVQALETGLKQGKIAAVHFRLARQGGAGREALFAHVYVQQLIPMQNEKND